MIKKNQVLDRKTEKPIVYDTFFNEDQTKKPIVIFCHGYKGFKDWGSWDLVAKAFMASDLFFVKFNFSHNGGTIEDPIDFPDLEAFAENNYTKELNDLESMLDVLVSENFEFKNEINPHDITVIGHSRGGGIAILKASEDERITKLITWASVSDFGKRGTMTSDLEQWKKDGVKYVLNGRTKQQMPHNYQFYKDYKANEARLSIPSAAKKIEIPYLIVHATDDPSVSFDEAEDLHRFNDKSELLPVQNSNHVFGSSHPWKEEVLPKALKDVVKKSVQFITA
jgi:pimeloyl-ACP methyl ester carboxylesterase